MSDQTTVFAPGQTWTPTRPNSRAKPRKVVWVGNPPKGKLTWVDYPTVGFVENTEAPAFPDTGHDSWTSVPSFRAWVRKHAAVCQEVPHA